MVPCGSLRFFCLCLLCLCGPLFICALRSPAGKGLTSWLSFVVYNCELSLSHWYPVSGVVLEIESLPDLCTLTYFLQMTFREISCLLKQDISYDSWYINRTLVKRAYRKTNFLISQPKHMLWVLKKTVSMRWLF